MVKNSPSNAREVGPTPGWGTKIPRAVGQLSPCPTAREPRATTKIQGHQNFLKKNKSGLAHLKIPGRQHDSAVLLIQITLLLALLRDVQNAAVICRMNHSTEQKRDLPGIP